MITGESFEKAINNLGKDISVFYVRCLSGDHHWQIILDIGNGDEVLIAFIYINTLSIELPTAGYIDFISAIYNSNRINKYPNLRDIPNSIKVKDLINLIYTTLTEKQLFEEILIIIENAFVNRNKANNRLLKYIRKIVKDKNRI